MDTKTFQTSESLASIQRFQESAIDDRGASGPGPDGVTWGGSSVLFATGWAGQSVFIPPHPKEETELPSLQKEDADSRFQLLSRLGHGGMGEVWRVRDRDLNRVVAMKILREDRLNEHQWLARFISEAQATAQLKHPGIVPVHELGRLGDGRLYYTM